MVMHVNSASLGRVCFVTLGCAKNEVDSRNMARAVRRAGFCVVEEPQCSDVIVVNTCSFIEEAIEESLGVIFDLSELVHEDGSPIPIVVAGCMPARYGDDLADELTEASLFVPCSKEDDIAALLAALLGVELPSAEAVFSKQGFTTAEPIALSAEHPSFATSVAEAHADGEETLISAYVKISDGCDRFCSYCTIPFIRGRYHSFPYEDIKAEVAYLVSNGTREIVLIAQDTGRWGADFKDGSSLATLLSGLAEAFPSTWFRVMYIQPEGITDELLEAVAAHSNICRYFDIPLQHVQAPLLKAMNRKGSRGEYEVLLSHFRELTPDATLRTTLIAGFPGETPDDFDELCDFFAIAVLDFGGVFAYSQEEGTRAARMPQQIDEDEKRYRAQQLRDVADTVCTARVAARVGSTYEVLVLGCEEDGQLFGRAQCQAPDVDGVVYLEQGSPGELLTVTIADTLLYEMEAE